MAKKFFSDISTQTKTFANTPTTKHRNMLKSALNSITFLSNQTNKIVELTDNQNLMEKATKIQQSVSQAYQSVTLAHDTIESVQQWGKRLSFNSLVANNRLSQEKNIQTGVMNLLGLKPSGLQFTLQVVGLPPESFEVIRFDLKETYSQVFIADIEAVSRNNSISGLADKEGVLSIWQDGKLLRQVAGMLSLFEVGDSGFQQTFYRFRITSELWRLTLRTNSRIFQQKDIETILSILLGENSITRYSFMLCHAHPEREFCVQYRETDYEFFNRLTAEEGIFYYFDKNSILIITDDATTLNQLTTLTYNPNKNAQLQEKTVNMFSHSEKVCVGRTVLRDYTFKKPDWKAEYEIGEGYEHYDYPGRFKDNRGKQYTGYRLDSLRREADNGWGETNSPELQAGKLLQLKKHPNESFNRRWQVTGVRYHGEQPQGAQQEAGDKSTILTGYFEVIPVHQTWRPLQRRKPLVDGPQVAIVTGPPGEEIYTDNFGRIRLQFLWDREGSYDDHSSCWIRVTEPWAGKGWGMIAIPRVGQEVIVDFLDGDPDQPIVTGRSYHANMVLPAELPKNKTQMHLMSQTYKGRGYNGMLMEDMKGKQRLDLHAQHDMNTLVLNDRTTNVGGNHTETVKGEQKISVNQSRYKEVVGDEVQTIGKNQEIYVGQDYQLNVTGELLMKSGADNIVFETAGAKLTLFKNGNIDLMGKSVVILGKMVDLNPGGGEAEEAAQGESSGDSSSNSYSGLFSNAGVFASKLAENKVTDAVAGKIANDLLDLTKNTTDLFMDRGLVAAGINGSNHVMREAPDALKSVIRGGAKHAPGIVGAALDFGTQIAQGENVTDATVKVAGHLGAGAIGAAIGTAIPIPFVGTAIGFAVGTGLGMLFDSAYDSYFK